MHNASQPDDSLLCLATLGTFTTSQEFVGLVAADIGGIDIDRLAEETLALVATTSARAVEVGRGQSTTTSSTLLNLPLLYREYLVGTAMLAGVVTPDAPESAVSERLGRAAQFYAAHFPVAVFPGERRLKDKLPLWMGRVSRPGLGETPDERVKRLGLVQLLLTHLKLILAYSRRDQGTG